MRLPSTGDGVTAVLSAWARR